MTHANEKTHRFVGGRWRRRDRCNQCNKPIAPGLANHPECQKRIELHHKDRSQYLATRAPRAQLEVPAGLRFTWMPDSKNEKLGGIPACIATPTTCPPSCGFYGNGCYAETGFMGGHWRRAGTSGISFAELLRRVSALRPGQLWRYAVAGDLPGVGDKLHIGAFMHLVNAAVGAGTTVLAYTHKPLERADERRAIAEANRRGFTVNLSSDSLDHADRRAELGIGPVVVVVPSDHARHSKTPGGRYVIVCPAQTHEEVTCASCGMCAVASRKSIVAFRAHGSFAAHVDEKTRPRKLPALRVVDGGP